jgi:hypothetical protein
MQEDFLDKLRVIDEMLQDLIQENEKWTKYNEELKRLEALFKDMNTLFESKSFNEKSLEEKQQILDVS